MSDLLLFIAAAPGFLFLYFWWRELGKLKRALDLVDSQNDTIAKQLDALQFQRDLIDQLAKENKELHADWMERHQ